MHNVSTVRPGFNVDQAGWNKIVSLASENEYWLPDEVDVVEMWGFLEHSQRKDPHVFGEVCQQLGKLVG